jgi:hypothetical protein
MTQNFMLISGKLQKYYNKNYFKVNEFGCFFFTLFVLWAKEALQLFSSNLFCIFS